MVQQQQQQCSSSSAAVHQQCGSSAAAPTFTVLDAFHSVPVLPLLTPGTFKT
jgi:hypothetical protein